MLFLASTTSRSYRLITCRPKPISKLLTEDPSEAKQVATIYIHGSPTNDSFQSMLDQFYSMSVYRTRPFVMKSVRKAESLLKQVKNQAH